MTIPPFTDMRLGTVSLLEVGAEQCDTLTWVAAQLSRACPRAALFDAPVAQLRGAEFDGFEEKSHHKFDEDSLRSLLQQQRQCATECAVFVWCGVPSSRTMRFLCMNGRHLGLTIVLVVKVKECLDMSVRLNIDYVFAAWDRNGTAEDRRRVYKRHFRSAFSTFGKFNAMAMAVTRNFSHLVLDTTPSAGPQICLREI